MRHSFENPASTPFDIDASIDAYYLSRVPKRKIVLGMPLYGRAFENTLGPGHPYSGVGKGTWESGVHDYKKLPLEGSVVKYDWEAGASYCFKDEGGGKGTMVSYDNATIARMKAELIVKEELGGGMWWEISADGNVGDDDRVVETVFNVLKLSGPRGIEWKENCLEFPESKFENLRKGFPEEY